MSINAFQAEAALAMMDDDYGRAEVHYKISLQRSTSYGGFVLNGLAGLAVLRGQYTLAEDYLNEALKDPPTPVFQAYEAGLLPFYRKRSESVRKYAQQIQDLYNSGVSPFAEVAVLGKHLRFLAAVVDSDGPPGLLE